MVGRFPKTPIDLEKTKQDGISVIGPGGGPLNYPKEHIGPHTGVYPVYQVISRIKTPGLGCAYQGDGVPSGQHWTPVLPNRHVF